MSDHPSDRRTSFIYPIRARRAALARDRWGEYRDDAHLAEFLRHAPEDIDALLAEVDRLWTAIDRLARVTFGPASLADESWFEVTPADRDADLAARDAAAEFRGESR
jgi:hypothetical protein